MLKLLTHLHRLLIIIALFFPVFVLAIYYPPPLYGQTSAYISSKLYFFGGTILNIDNSTSYNHDIFYLDLSKSFNTTSIYPWYNESITLNISHIDASACVGGALQDNIFVFEGQPESIKDSEGNFAPLIYNFDIQKKEISQPQINVAVNVPKRRSVQAICDKQGKMYVFGGIDDFTTNNEKFVYNRMDIFNTIELLLYGWSVGNVSQSAGGGRYGYAAVLLNDNERIVYIGGRLTSGEYLKMNDIYIYNIKVNQWHYQQNVGGDIPGVRESHSAVISKTII
jgi:N-acetylneuraminic acid mutarotase